MRPLRTSLTVVALAACLGAGSCGGTPAKAPDGIVDRAATATTGTVPTWFPSRFVPPPGAAVIEVVATPEPGIGRTVTWRVPGSYDDVVRQVEATLNSLGWRPTDIRKESTGGSRRTALFVENAEVEVVRVFDEKTLDGVRVTVELAR